MLKNRSWTPRLTLGRLMLLLAVAAFPMALAFGQKPETTETASQAVVKKRAINKLVKDFPDRMDLSTPESAMAALSHGVARRKDIHVIREGNSVTLDGRNWVKLDSQSAKKYAGAVVNVTENSGQQVLDTEIVEVLTYNDDLAAVIHKSGRYPPNRQYAAQYFGRSKGVWWMKLDLEATGENFFTSVAAAEENFGKRKGDIWQAFVKTRDLVERGLDDLRTKKYNEAIAAFSETISVDPKVTVDDALFWRGMAYFFKDKEDCGKAIADFTEYLKRTPDVDMAAVCRYLRGLAFASQKDGLDKARDDMMVALALDSNVGKRLAGAYLICSIAYAREGRLDYALAHATGAVQLDPENADAYAVRGYVYEKKGDYAKAVADREASKRFRATTPNHNDMEEIAFAKALHRCLLQLVPTLERPEQQPSASASSSLGTSQMSIVNPRIIVQPEEEERLGVVPP